MDIIGGGRGCFLKYMYFKKREYLIKRQFLVKISNGRGGEVEDIIIEDKMYIKEIVPSFV